MPRAVPPPFDQLRVVCSDRNRGRQLPAAESIWPGCPHGLLARQTQGDGLASGLLCKSPRHLLHIQSVPRRPLAPALGTSSHPRPPGHCPTHQPPQPLLRTVLAAARRAQGGADGLVASCRWALASVATSGGSGSTWAGCTPSGSLWAAHVALPSAAAAAAAVPWPAGSSSSSQGSRGYAHSSRHSRSGSQWEVLRQQVRLLPRTCCNAWLARTESKALRQQISHG